MLKRALKILMWIVASILALFFGMVVLLEKPYIRNIDEFRTTGQLETVRVSYGHACGEEFLSDGENKYILAIPEGGKNPLDIPGIYFDSSFELVGYSYTIKRKNYLTGEVTTVRSERFDTVEWRTIIPYNIYYPDSEDLRKRAYSPMNWKSDNINPKFIVQQDVTKGEC